MFKLPNFKAMYQDMAMSSPQMARNQVWCHNCGTTQQVDSAECLRHGWPKCCNRTMSIDSPEERRKRPAKP
jgi:hypothetical protein